MRAQQCCESDPLKARQVSAANVSLLGDPASRRLTDGLLPKAAGDAREAKPWRRCQGGGRSQGSHLDPTGASLLGFRPGGQIQCR